MFQVYHQILNCQFHHKLEDNLGFYLFQYLKALLLVFLEFVTKIWSMHIMVLFQENTLKLQKVKIRKAGNVKPCKGLQLNFLLKSLNIFQNFFSSVVYLLLLFRAMHTQRFSPPLFCLNQTQFFNVPALSLQICCGQVSSY